MLSPSVTNSSTYCAYVAFMLFSTHWIPGTIQYQIIIKNGVGTVAIFEVASTILSRKRKKRTAKPSCARVVAYIAFARVRARVRIRQYPFRSFFPQKICFCFRFFHYAVFIFDELMPAMLLKKSNYTTNTHFYAKKVELCCFMPSKNQLNYAL